MAEEADRELASSRKNHDKLQGGALPDEGF
jgi:hypothetical protein